MSGSENPPPTLRISWTALGVVLVVLAGWLLAFVHIVAWAGTDVGCLGSRLTRGAHIEIAICSMMSGPKGWLALAWFARPGAALMYWLRQKLGGGK